MQENKICQCKRDKIYDFLNDYYVDMESGTLQESYPDLIEDILNETCTCQEKKEQVTINLPTLEEIGVKVDVRTVEEGKMVLSSKKEEPKQECDHIVAIDEAMYPTLLSITHVKSTSTVYGILQWDFMNKLPKDYRDGVPRKYQRRFKHCLLCGIEVNWELIKESLKQSNE